MDPKYIEIYDLVQASPDEYLMHHQIKGAKWGVRRGPPYPLESGIRTKIKKVTKAAENRMKQNQAKRAAKTAAKKAAADEVKKRKENSKAEKKETLQDKIDKMSDEELIARTNRLKLENAYRQQLPPVEKGKNFLEKSADVFKTLKTVTTAVTEFGKAGKDFLKLFGLTEDSIKDDSDWSKRMPGETAKDYAERLQNLVNINQRQNTLRNAEERERARQSGGSGGSKSSKKKKKTGNGSSNSTSAQSTSKTAPIDWTKDDPDDEKKR